MASNETPGGLTATIRSSRAKSRGGGDASTSLGTNGEDHSESPPFVSSEVETARDHPPERTCILTRVTGDRASLIRLAISPDGAVLPDVRAKAPGRGAWIGVDRAALEAAQAKGRLRGALARAFKGRPLTLPEDLGARIAAALERAFLDRLGLEARAGMLVTGSDRIEEAARKGRVHLLLHASDAGADGTRRLAQAWRVGRDAEGSGEAGVALPLPRTILAMALGRENVVHVAIVDRAAAGRVSHALGRWRGFIGSDFAGTGDGQDPHEFGAGAASPSRHAPAAED